MKFRSFVHQICAVILGFMLSLVGLFLIVLFACSRFCSGKLNRKVVSHTVLVLDLKGKQLVETALSRPFFCYKENKVVETRVLKRAIGTAAKDARIDALYVKLACMQAGWAVLEEIREALLAFKAQGKPIVVYGDTYTNKSYYLASVADEIVLNPSGYLGFNGLSETIYFYPNLLEKVGVKPILVRAGKYKDYGESFCLHSMSTESKQQRQVYLSCIYEHFLTKISLARHISIADLKLYANQLSAILPKDAHSANLITKIDYEVEARKLLKEKIGKAHGMVNPAFISYAAYSSSPKQADATAKVTVVSVEGTMINGKTTIGYTGAYDFAKTLKTLEEDASVKAVVVRINSPGGSVLAADIMWKAIEDLKVSKKVVASMSDLAASGGYYIAAPCHYIFAQPTTLTGSIGVFGLLFDPTQLMHKIGIEQDGVKTAPSADFLHPRLSCSETELRLLHKMVQTWYCDSFLSKVAQGRALPIEQVEKLASGRVYTGRAAHSNGLVDELGNLDAAICKAAALAGLTEKYMVQYLPYCTTPLERLWEQLGEYIGSHSVLGRVFFNQLTQGAPLFGHLLMMQSPCDVQAMLPYGIVVA